MGGGVKRLHLTRRRGFYGMARALRIEVDGEPVGEIRQNGVLEVEVPESAAVMVGRMDWGRTEPLALAGVPDGARIEIHGRMTLSQRRMLGLDTLPIAFRLLDAGETGA